MAVLDPPPTIAPVTSDRSTSLMSSDWMRWVLALRSIVNVQAQQIGSTVNLTQQSATVAATSIPLPALSNGNYRVSYYLEKTTADGVSSSTQVTIGWTHNSKSLTHQFAALTTDTTTATDAQTLPMLIDQNSAITYAVSYASNTPGKMQYLLTLWVEQA